MRPVAGRPAPTLPRSRASRRRPTAVDPVLAEVSRQLDLSRSWPALKRKTSAATAMTPATGPRAFAAWDRVSTDTVKLIAEAADKSNLTLDPDLDTYYLQDTITVKIPTLIDSGRAWRRPRCCRCQGPSRRDRDRSTARSPARSRHRRRTSRRRSRTPTILASGRVGGPLSALARAHRDHDGALTKVSATDRAPAPDIAAASRRDALALSHALDVRLDDCWRYASVAATRKARRRGRSPCSR